MPPDSTPTYELQRGGYLISTDPARLDPEAIHALLGRSYWAANRTYEQIVRALAHSLCFGIYTEDAQIGLARVISDYTTYAYLCDVFIDEAHRSQGLGIWLIGAVVGHPDLCNLRRFVLATSDAHGLYARYGFVPIREPEKWMEFVREGL